MKCDKCNENIANIHLTQIVDGEVIETNICESCAVINPDLGLFINFDFGNIFKVLGEDIKNIDDLKERQCSNCNMTYSQIINSGKIGCPQCYVDFQDELKELFKSMYGRENHIGKIPSKSVERIKEDQLIENLEARLEKAIISEDFESAAIIRDEINRLNELDD